MEMIVEAGVAMTLEEFFDPNAGVTIDPVAYAKEAEVEGVCSDCVTVLLAGGVPAHCKDRLPQPCTYCGVVPEVAFIYRDRATQLVTRTDRYSCACRE